MTAHLSGKLVFYDVPASDLDKSRKFYAALLGTDDFAQAPSPKLKSLFHPLSADGIDITIHPKRDQNPPDITMAYFAVDDLQAAVKALVAAGGKKVHGPVDIPLPAGPGLAQYKASAKAARQQVGGRVGQGVTMLDPDSNPVGIVQLEGYAAFYFRAGPFHTPLRADQYEGLKQASAAAAG